MEVDSKRLVVGLLLVFGLAVLTPELERKHIPAIVECGKKVPLLVQNDESSLMVGEGNDRKSYDLIEILF